MTAARTPAWIEGLRRYSPSTHYDVNYYPFGSIDEDRDGAFVRLSDLLAAWQHQEEHDPVRRAAQTVLETFMRDEAQGYLSRDRQYAITLLGAALRVPAGPEPER